VSSLLSCSPLFRYIALHGSNLFGGGNNLRIQKIFVASHVRTDNVGLDDFIKNGALLREIAGWQGRAREAQCQGQVGASLIGSGVAEPGKMRVFGSKEGRTRPTDSSQS
jgi:hypothetical protein